MDILEIVFALIQGCGCFLDLCAAGSSVGAGVAGVKANQGRQLRKEAMRRGEQPPANKAALWFVLLLIIAASLVVLVLWKYSRRH